MFISVLLLKQNLSVAKNERDARTARACEERF